VGLKPTYDEKGEDSKKKPTHSSLKVQCEACGCKGHELEGCFVVFPEKRPTNGKSNPEREKIKHDLALAKRVKGLKTKKKKVNHGPTWSSNKATNDIKRLTSYRPVEGESLWSGDTQPPILGYDTMTTYPSHSSESG
jgi:hypothetical protein